MRRMVKPGGLICISVPDQDGPIRFIEPCIMNMPPHHATRWRRPSFEALAREPRIGAFMVRYNAAHTGAESEVFPRLGESPPGVVAYTATRWGDLLQRSLVPESEPVPRASDCYRFALSHPAVDVVAAGPAGREQLDEALAALDRGPMSDEEIAWMKRVGAAVRSRRRAQSTAVGLIDRWMGANAS